MPAPEPSLLPGQSPPLFVVTPTDQAGVIVNVAAICLVFALASILIRSYVRFDINQQAWAWGDSVIIAALAFYLIHVSIVFHELSLGLGKAIYRLDRKQMVGLQRSMYGDDIFYIAAVWMTKLSTASIFARTARDRTFLRTNKALAIGIALMAIVSILLITIRCDLSHPWIWFSQNGATCTSLLAHWKAIATLDIVTEVLLAAMSVFLVWPVQISVRKKVTVALVFSTRLAVIAPIVCHLHYVSKALSSRDPSLASTSVVISKEVQIALAILATNIPKLRPFIFATTTNYGAPAEGPKTTHGNSNSNGNRTGPQIFSLKSLTRRGREVSSHPSQDEPQHDGEVDAFRPGGSSANASNVTTGRPRSSGSNDSKQIIIRKDYSVAYFDGPSNG